MVGWCPAVDFCPMWFYHSGFLSYRPLFIAVECFTLYLFLSYASLSFFILYLILPSSLYTFPHFTKSIRNLYISY